MSGEEERESHLITAEKYVELETSTLKLNHFIYSNTLILLFMGCSDSSQLPEIYDHEGIG